MQPDVHARDGIVVPQRYPVRHPWSPLVAGVIDLPPRARHLRPCEQVQQRLVHHLLGPPASVLHVLQRDPTVRVRDAPPHSLVALPGVDLQNIHLRANGDLPDLGSAELLRGGDDRWFADDVVVWPVFLDRCQRCSLAPLHLIGHRVANGQEVPVISAAAECRVLGGPTDHARLDFRPDSVNDVPVRIVLHVRVQFATLVQHVELFKGLGIRRARAAQCTRQHA
mmetsp:Transcript_29006/g.76680  ORF Transcript_29006/g.76680 Transcript_29006/m.76680 type:complete len:224 (-) Transcript_29006:155-826(-)